MFPNFDGSPEGFEKMKRDLIEQGYDWEHGWAFLPFVAAFGSVFKNPDDSKGNDCNER